MICTPRAHNDVNDNIQLYNNQQSIKVYDNVYSDWYMLSYTQYSY